MSEQLHRVFKSKLANITDRREYGYAEDTQKEKCNSLSLHGSIIALLNRLYKRFNNLAIFMFLFRGCVD